MNTAVKIKSCNFVTASKKNGYNLTRQKNQKSDIFVIEDNGFPKQKKELSDKQKKEKHDLQRTITVSTKRLKKAIQENKPKSILTNQKNLDEALKKIKKFENKLDEREKNFVEFTVALTNSKGEKYDKNWALESVEFFKKRYPQMRVVSVVEHRDQHSPHIHLLMCGDEPTSKILAGGNDTSREKMKEVYSKIANDFNDFAKFALAPQIAGLERGRKYVSLGQFKKKGNYQAKNKEKELKEDERRRIENENRRACVDGARARIGGHHTAIEKLYAGSAEAHRDEQKIEALGAKIEFASDIFELIANSIERLKQLVRTGGGAELKSEEQKLVDAQLARNAQKRANNGKTNKSNTNPHHKP